MTRARRLFGRPASLEKMSDADREHRHRASDREFQRALAFAILRGDHLPQAMRAAA